MGRVRMAVVAVLALVCGGMVNAGAEPMPGMLDAMGPIQDVTESWTEYQPSESFCVTLDGFDGYTAFSGDPGPTCPESEDLLVEIDTPDLCTGCRRLFINYAMIPEANDPGAGLFYARGHVFFRMHAFNPNYTANPLAHSPNIKNFTNDKFIAPYDSPQEQAATAFDTRAIAYVGSTLKHTHSEIQGPYYVGPTYRNHEGRLIRGAYIDVDAQDSLGVPELDQIRYWVGYNSGEATCPDNVLFDGEYADGNYGYGACAAHPAVSESVIDPVA